MDLFCEGRAWIFSRNRWEIKIEHPAKKRVGRGFEPKDGVVFIALLPQFVDAAAPVAPQILLLGFIVTLTAIPCDLGVAVGTGKVARWLRGNVKLQKLQNRVSGGILLGLGAYVAIAGRQD